MRKQLLQSPRRLLIDAVQVGLRLGFTR